MLASELLTKDLLQQQSRQIQDQRQQFMQSIERRSLVPNGIGRYPMMAGMPNGMGVNLDLQKRALSNNRNM